MGLFARVGGFLVGVFLPVLAAGDLGACRVLVLRLEMCAVSEVSHFEIRAGRCVGIFSLLD